MNENENQPVERQAIHYAMTDIRYRIGSTVWQTELNEADARLILIVTAGEGWIIKERTRIRLERGQGYVFPPGSKVQFDYSGERPACFYALYFVAKRTEAGKRESDLLVSEAETFLDERILEPQPFARFVELLEVLYRYRHDHEPQQSFYRHIRFLELLGFLLFRAGIGKDGSQNTRMAVERSIERMRRQFREATTVKRLAAEANVGRWQYTRLFRELTGKIPLDFLNGLRIDHAKQLLRSTGDRLYDIATNTGFSNEYYFNRRFKQTVGVTPSLYRRVHQRQLPHGEVRVVAPCLEDFVLALGIRPVLQWSHAKWGKQDYLGLEHTPEFEITSADFGMLTEYKPDLILLDGGMDRSRFEPYGPTYQVKEIGKDWRSSLRTIAELLGCPNRAEQVIRVYDEKAAAARDVLTRLVRGKSVAVLRISAGQISFYGISSCDYIHPILYGDLGLTPHSFVRELTLTHNRAFLTPELLSRLDADVLFVAFDKFHSNRRGEERKVLQDPLWRALPAVRSNSVYEVDFLSWMNYGVISNGKKIDDVLNVLA